MAGSAITYGDTDAIMKLIRAAMDITTAPKILADGGCGLYRPIMCAGVPTTNEATEFGDGISQLCYDTTNDEVVSLAETVKSTMEGITFPWLNVPLVVDIQIGRNWGELKEI